jgi:hypothetical protein
VGALGVFWDDLDQRDGMPTTAHSNVYVGRVPAFTDPLAPIGHTIVQWHDVKCFGVGSATTPQDSMHFQAKLFDDGVIEFHYGLMKNGTKSIAYAEGEDGASWIENATGTEALIINTNSRTPGIHSYTAFRFSPL